MAVLEKADPEQFREKGGAVYECDFAEVSVCAADA